ncbi:MAG TPA: tRNA (N(6)-L-threonylcarbamoyladenosine(37)-C(2))-methylthiotransferase MtaB [Planctomycetes bacterium]|jgi:threonylcarbamoyladenosine tRNA methylthiotransferase MtaB|nr:tRNA (N(6)-L-threonylcarbamoyladenosine(37)-C(2))-methylthiotransferase MtaB [Planctomycetota bacterium]
MESKTAAFITLGCKINQYETEAIRREVLELGYEEVRASTPADVYVVNTCSVTAQSGAKSRKYIQRAARTNPEARIVVVGCSSDQEKESFSKIPQVALLGGNEEKPMVASFLDGCWNPGEEIPAEMRDIFELNISGFGDRTRATVKVQDGCNNYCSFCIIPFLRGLSKSRDPDAVIDEIRRLVDNGYIEVVVSGVHLQDYGLELDPSLDLVDLLRRIGAVEGLRRVRLSSLGARAFTPQLIDLLEDPVFCRHWHIPLQAGSDKVLEVMRRGYTIRDFRLAVEELTERFDDPSITSDVIVGHPGETEDDFSETIERCREFGFSKIHVFPFSMREGTLAATLKREVVDPAEVRRRAGELGAVDRELNCEYRERFIGRELDVLVEGASRGRDDWLEGLAGRYLKVAFPAPSPGAARRFQGTLQRVKIDKISEGGLDGHWDEVPVDASGVAL